MVNHKGTQVLTTPRLTLRPFMADDAPAMFANWAGDPEVTKFLTWPTHPNVEVSQMICNDWASHYTESDYYQWAIVYNGQPIGSMAVVDHDERIGKA
jgi:ribosomal-protein-alanine N-acetyltransferase